jgi:integrase
VGKPSSINRELSTLSQLFKAATTAKPRWIGLDAVPTIPHLKEGDGRIIALSPAQCESLLNAAAHDLDADLLLFVLIGLNTSMRHGEIKKLRLDYLDEHRRRFFIPDAKAGEREQPMTAELVQTLVKIRDDRKDKAGYLFKPNPRQQGAAPGLLSNGFQARRQRSGHGPGLGHAPRDAAHGDHTYGEVRRRRGNHSKDIRPQDAGDGAPLHAH